MNSNDKEYLLSVLDEVVTTLAVVSNDNVHVNPNIYNRISRAMMIVEKSIMENDSGGPYTDPGQAGLDFHPWQDRVYDDTNDGADNDD